MAVVILALDAVVDRITVVATVTALFLTQCRHLDNQRARCDPRLASQQWDQKIAADLNARAVGSAVLLVKTSAHAVTRRERGVLVPPAQAGVLEDSARGDLTLRDGLQVTILSVAGL